MTGPTGPAPARWLRLLRGTVRTVLRADPETLEAAGAFLRLPDPDAYHRNRALGRPLGDGRWRSLLDRRSSFPSGLVPLLAAEILAGWRADGLQVSKILSRGTDSQTGKIGADWDAGLAPDQVSRIQLLENDSQTGKVGLLSVLDSRPLLVEPDWSVMLDLPFRPYDHQWEAARALARDGTGTIKVGTGGGKGNLAVMLMACVATRWLFVCHRRQVINLTARRWERLTGQPYAILGRDPIRDQRVVFATFAALYRGRNNKAAGRFFASLGGVMCDEAHTVGARTHAWVVEQAVNARWRVGLSATPFDRSDQNSVLVAAQFGPIVYEVATERLVEQKVVARPTVLLWGPVSWQDGRAALDVEDFWQQAGPRGFADPAELYQQTIVLNRNRNDAVLAAVQDAAQLERLPAIVFVRRLQHGKQLAAALRAAGFRARFVWGKMSVQKREDLCYRLGRDLDVLVGNVVLQEGIDIDGEGDDRPRPLRSIVNAGGGRSTIAILQQAGRAMRTAGGKKFECWIYDFVDTGQDNLENNSRKRIAAYRKARYQMQYRDGQPFRPAKTRKRSKKENA